MSSLKGAGALRNRLKAVEKAPAGLMRRLALSAVGQQKRLAPVRTGNLRRTIHIERVTRSSATTVASANYAAFVELGTKPHVIRPRRKKVLRFSAGGRVVFTKYVNHPGTKAQPFMLPGAQKALADVGVKEIIDAWNSAA